jgi:RNA polymerase-interacting CarD/CdnL/TRCF family regulator
MLRKQDLADTVRFPINARDARRILRHLEKCDGRMSRQWKARANANQTALERGDPFGYADVVKGLTRLEEEGNLRASDRTHLNQSLTFLSEELANALETTPDKARDMIYRRCRRKIAK